MPNANTERKIYTAGTLRYTMPQLIITCFWVICSLLSLNLLAYKMVPTMMPLLFDRHHISATMMAIILSTVPSLLNLIINPILSTMSDKTRTKWGRRIPYLAISTPFIVFFMILIGFEPDLTKWIQQVFFPGKGEDQVGFWVLACLTILFQISYLVPGSIACYIYADVVPKQFIGTFMGICTFLGTGITFVFNYFILSPAVNNPKLFFPLIGGIYFISYLCLTLFVKEGSYPPVDDKIEPNTKFLDKARNYIRLYFKECCSHRIYVMLFVTLGLTQASTFCRNAFNLLFATKDLHMSAAEFGKTMAIGAVVSAVVVLPMGKVMDKIHPIRVFLFSGLIVIIMNIWGYFCVKDTKSFMFIGISIVLIYAIQNLSINPLLIDIVPMDKFGQFASANALVNCGIMLIASTLGGYFTDLYGYRMIFIWDFFVTIVATFALLIVYKDWKRLGGQEHYTPPKLY